MRFIIFLLLVLPCLSLAQVNNNSPGMDWQDVSRDLDQSGKALNRYHRQVNTAQILQISRIVLSSIDYAVSDADNKLIFLSLGGAVSFAGVITFISADKHIDQAGIDLRNAAGELHR